MAKKREQVKIQIVEEDEQPQEKDDDVVEKIKPKRQYKTRAPKVSPAISEMAVAPPTTPQQMIEKPSPDYSEQFKQLAEQIQSIHHQFNHFNIQKQTPEPGVVKKTRKPSVKKQKDGQPQPKLVERTAPEIVFL